MKFSFKLNPMNYKVLARKYRPQNFEQLIGQDLLVDTLKNSIKNGRLAHAFLLTGIRGVGKTTTARIIAKAFNCEGNNNKGPTFEICNNCEPCKSITNGNCLDVIELDAASKTGVENIREIIDSVMYVPNEARLKIYIIDEVHMLSTPAFNALLKTLEEPPETCKFIFATTEIKKIPATIISRCQRFDLKRIDHEVLIEHLKFVCEKEKISFDNDTLSQISVSSEGSVRDALSILDQIAALTDNDINIIKLREMLGLKDKIDYLNLFIACLNGEASSSMDIFYKLIYEGVQAPDVVSTLINICSDSCKFTINEKLLKNYEREYDQISKFGITQLIRSWQILIKGLDELRNEVNQIEIVSMIIVKLCYSSQTPMPKEILKRIDQKFLKNRTTNLKLNDQKIADEKPLNISENNSLIPSIVKENVSEQPKKQEIDKYEKFLDFDELLSSLINNKEGLLHAKLINNIHLESFNYGEIKLKVLEENSFDLIKRINEFLLEKTGFKWKIIEVDTDVSKTYNEIRSNNIEKEKESFSSIQVFKDIKDQFPDAKIRNINKL